MVSAHTAIDVQRADLVGTEAEPTTTFAGGSLSWGEHASDSIDALEETWLHAYKELEAPDASACLHTETPGSSEKWRQAVTEVVFEKFEPPSFYLATRPVLRLYAAGSLTGMVVGSGDSISYTYGIFEGYAVPTGNARCEIGGRNLTTLLAQRLAEKLTDSVTRVTLEDIKETCCALPPLRDDASKDSGQCAYELPDGRTVVLDRERWQVPEALFRPTILGSNARGLHSMVYESIASCDVDLHKAFYSQIVLSGGNMRFKGMGPRLQSELRQLAPSNTKVMVAVGEMAHPVWVGGSILAFLSNYRHYWITKQQYDEIGCDVIRRHWRYS